MKTLIKLTISLTIVIWLIHGVDIREFTARFSNINLYLLLLAVLLLFSLAFLHAARWVEIIRVNQAVMSYKTAIQLVLEGYFFSQALPSSIGGDAVRIWRAHKAGLSLTSSINTVILDRLFGLIALLLMTLMSVPWLMNLLADTALRWAIILILISSMVSVLMLLTLARLEGRDLKWKVVSSAIQISVTAKRILFNTRSSLVTLILSVGVHFFVALSIFILAHALGIVVGFVNCVVLIPLVMLVTLLPISIAGWGIREGAMVVALSLIQVSRSDAIAVSLLFGTIMLIVSLPGGLFWLRTRYPSKFFNLK